MHFYRDPSPELDNSHIFKPINIPTPIDRECETDNKNVEYFLHIDCSIIGDCSSLVINSSSVFLNILFNLLIFYF